MASYDCSHPHYHYCSSLSALHSFMSYQLHCGIFRYYPPCVCVRDYQSRVPLRSYNLILRLFFYALTICYGLLHYRCYCGRSVFKYFQYYCRCYACSVVITLVPLPIIQLPKYVTVGCITLCLYWLLLNLSPFSHNRDEEISFSLCWHLSNACYHWGPRFRIIYVKILCSHVLALEVVMRRYSSLLIMLL